MTISSDLYDEIRKLELASLDPEVRSDPARLGELLADDFIEFGSSGRVWDKAAVLAELSEETGLAFELSELSMAELAADVVHTTFRIAVRDASSVRHSLRSSLWVRREGRWQIRFHQGTACERATE